MKNPFRSLIRYHSPGEKISPWRGVLWVDYYSQRVVTTIVPLNLIVRLVLLVWMWLWRPFKLFDAAHELRFIKERHRREIQELKDRHWEQLQWHDEQKGTQ